MDTSRDRLVELQTNHDKLVRQQINVTVDNKNTLVEEARRLLQEIREAGRIVSDSANRLVLEAYASHWGLFLAKQTGEYPKTFLLPSDKSASDAVRCGAGQIRRLPTTFHGRRDELSVLQEWITEDRCRLVAILGFGGIGKTALAKKIVESVQGDFTAVQWRSLRTAPYLEDLLRDLLRSFNGHNRDKILEDDDIALCSLMEHIEKHRCLLILDNFESILKAGAVAYKDRYENYASLLREIARLSNGSSLIITSREKPAEFSTLETQEPHLIRSYTLKGLRTSEAVSLFKEWGVLSDADESESETGIVKDIARKCEGNPLILKIVASEVMQREQGTLAKWEGVRAIKLRVNDVLDAQVSRVVSKPARDLLYWLAIIGEAVPREALIEQGLQLGPVEMKAGEQALIAHSLLDQEAGRLDLHPALTEYVTNKIIETITQEVLLQRVDVIDKYPLVQAKAQENIRESQMERILRPAVQKLQKSCENKESLTNKFKDFITKLQERTAYKTGYAAGNIVNMLVELEGGKLSEWNFSKLPVWEAYLQGITLHNVSFAGSDLSYSAFSKTLGSILSVAFSPDGQLFATGDEDCKVCIWRVVDGSLVAVCSGHTNFVWSVAFSPDSEMLASGSGDRKIRLWKVSDGTQKKELEGHTSWIRAVAFSPDGKTLASGASDHMVKLWDVCTGQCLHTLSSVSGHMSWVWSVAFNRKGQLASGGDDSMVKLWDVDKGKFLDDFPGHKSGVRSVAFSPDENTLASAGGDGTIRLWDVTSGKCKSSDSINSWIYSITFSPTDNNLLASGSSDGCIRLWDASTVTVKCLRTIPTDETAHERWVWFVAFSPNGQTLASGGDDQKVRLWDVKTSKPLRTLQGHTNWVRAVAFSPDSGILASAHSDRTVKLWDINTFEIKKTLTGHTGKLRCVAFSPDGQQLASGSDDHTIRVWDVRTGQCQRILEGHPHIVGAVAFSPDSKNIASCGDDKLVKLWEISTGNWVPLPGHTDWVWSVAFGRDNIQTLASGGEDCTVRLWNVSSGVCLHTLQEHKEPVQSVAVNPDCSIVASCSEDKTVKLWDVCTGECLKTLEGHSSWVWTVAFSPDGHMLASGGNDNTVILWDVSTGKELDKFEGHTSWIWTVAFSPDAQMLVSGSQDETIRLWDLKKKDSRILRTERLYEGMDITDATGLDNDQRKSLKALGAISS